MSGRAGSGRVSRRGLPERRSGRGRPGRRLRVPEARTAYTAAIADSAGLLAAADALDAEVRVASSISAIRSDVATDEAFTVLLLDLIDEAERDGRAGCVALLTALAAVGPREVAKAAAWQRAAPPFTQPRRIPGITWSPVEAVVAHVPTR